MKAATGMVARNALAANTVVLSDQLVSVTFAAIRLRPEESPRQLP
jgi:hypothetical protein